MTGYGFFGQFQKIEQQLYLPKNLDNRVASERMLGSGRKMLVGGRKYDGKLVGGKCHQIDFILSFVSASEGLLSWSSF